MAITQAYVQLVTIEMNEGETGSPEGQDSSEESAKDLQGFSEKDTKELKNFIALLKKGGFNKGATEDEEQEDNEETDQADPEEDKESNSTIDELKKRITELEKDKNDSEDKRKKDLLSELSDKDQVKYKDKSLDGLELIVEYIRDNPKRGISKTPKPTTDSETQSDTLRKRGTIGSYDPKTKTWGKNRQ